MSDEGIDPSLSTLRLYRFRWDCGRQGSLDGLFAVDDYGEQCLRSLIASGREVYFGEVLGKHSEIFGKLAEKELQSIPATPDEIATVLRVLGVELREHVALIEGFCPLQCEGVCEVDPEKLLEWARGASPTDDTEV